MKTNRLLLASALLTGVFTFAVAGPGPEYWTRTKSVEKQKTEATAQAAVQAAAQTPAQVAACGNCSCSAMKKA